MVAILMISPKLATIGLPKIFLNNGYDVMISVHDVTNKVLLHDSSYIVDAVMCQDVVKLGLASLQEKLS